MTAPTGPIQSGGSEISPSGISVHYRRLKIITFTIAGVDYSCALNQWSMINNTVDGDKTFTYCGNPSEFRTETDDNWSLQVKFYADWRLNGISDYLIQNTRNVAAFQLDHHPDIVGEHVRWTGNVVLKAPSVGGDIRALEETTVSLLILGLPSYTRVG
jgi:hypothetical protein